MLCRFLRHAMTLHTGSDHIHLVTNSTLIVFGSEGRPQEIVPGRRTSCDAMRKVGRPPGMLPAQVQHLLALQNGTPLAMRHLKKMQLSAPGPQMRNSSGGGMRPPMLSAANSQQHQLSPVTIPASPNPFPIECRFASYTTACRFKWCWSSCHFHAACRRSQIRCDFCSWPQ
jgi:hypothetical protein